MADISKITLPSGTTYNIKDATARSAIANLNSFEYTVCSSAATTPKDVVWKNSSGTSVTGTLVASASTMHKIYLVPSTNGSKDIYDEYITINTGSSTYVWEMFGNTDVHMSDLGALAKKDSVSATYKPAGTVSQPTFTGTSGDVSVSGTPAGKVKALVSSVEQSGYNVHITPTGRLANTKIRTTLQSDSNDHPFVASSANGGGAVTAGTKASCTLPSLTATVSNETLTLGWTAGSFTANNPTVVTLPSFTEHAIPNSASTTLADDELSMDAIHLGFEGSSTTFNGTFKPAGTVSTPTFSGTSATITSS